MMTKRILIVNDNVGQEVSRLPRSEEIDEILEAVLSQLIRNNQEQQNLVEFLEEQLIRIALNSASNNKTHASKSLGLHRKQLERRVRKYQLSGRKKSTKNVESI